MSRLIEPGRDNQLPMTSEKMAAKDPVCTYYMVDHDRVTLDLLGG